MSNTTNFNNFVYPPSVINTIYTGQPIPQWNWGNYQYLQNFNTSVPPPPPLPPPNFNTPPPNHKPPLPPASKPESVAGSIPGPNPHISYSHLPGITQYSPKGGRYNNQPYCNGPQQNSSQMNYKRPRLDSGKSTKPKKAVKKKKRPISETIPKTITWTLGEAEKALRLEREYNKRCKHHSLIIRFPDLEVNKDIVSKFHDAIENVHFQLSSTARSCFVTLQASADADLVISALNKVKFGNGYITAEYKRDRDDDQTIGSGDIDPLTLYVGNLAQEITKEDMVKAFPKCRRIDIGYARKMKYTRYAFVMFKHAADSIAAFTSTHNTEMYSKSLIVRFRRLRGAVGMPGESKPANQRKNKIDHPEQGLGQQLEPEPDTDFTLYRDEDERVNGINLNDIGPLPVTRPVTKSSIQSPPVNENYTNITHIKEEPASDDEEKEKNINYITKPIHHKPKIKTEVKTEIKIENKNDEPIYVDSDEATSKDVFFDWGNEPIRRPKEEKNDSDYHEKDIKPTLDYPPKSIQRFVSPRPKIKTEVKTEIKLEDENDEPIFIDSHEGTSKDVIFRWGNESIRRPKEKKHDYDYYGGCQGYTMYNASDEEDESDDILKGPADFDRLYEDMANHANVINSLI